jgi:hypothetical protein
LLADISATARMAVSSRRRSSAWRLSSRWCSESSCSRFSAASCSRRADHVGRVLEDQPQHGDAHRQQHAGDGEQRGGRARRGVNLGDEERDGGDGGECAGGNQHGAPPQVRNGGGHGRVAGRGKGRGDEASRETTKTSMNTPTTVMR